MIVDWFKKRNVRTRRDTINYIMLIVRYSLPEVLQNALQK